MKCFKNRYLSLCIAASIAMTGTIHPGFFSSKKAVASSGTGLFSFVKTTGEAFFMMAGVATILAGIWMGLSHLFGNNKGDRPIPAPKIPKRKKKKKNPKKKPKPAKNPAKPSEGGSEQSGENDDSGEEPLEEKGEAVDIPDHLKPYVQKARRFSGINYVQLKTVNQFDSAITACVTQKYKATGKNRSFQPQATCACQSIRSAFYLELFLSQQNGGREVKWLKRMGDKARVEQYLQKLVNKDLPTSWLRVEEVEGRLERVKISQDKKVSLSSKTVVVDSVINFDKGKEGFLEQSTVAKVNGVKRAFKDNDNYFHMFIINTGDMYSNGLMDARDKVEAERDCKIDNASFIRLLQRESSKTHYYAIALQKAGDNITCYIVDTMPSDDHIGDWEFYYRNRYLCEHIIHGNSEPDFREVMLHYGKETIRDAIQTGGLKINVKKGKKGKAKPKLKKVAVSEKQSQQDQPKKQLNQSEKQPALRVHQRRMIQAALKKSPLTGSMSSEVLAKEEGPDRQAA